MSYESEVDEAFGASWDPPGCGKMFLKFRDFHRRNPRFYDLAVHYSRVLLRGNSMGAIDMIFNRVRWDYSTNEVFDKPDADFKLNDHYRAFYARVIMRREPDLASFFEVRKQREYFDPAWMDREF